jgi:TolB-like protein/thioredoxin-like negative regulator of GroEL
VPAPPQDRLDSWKEIAAYLNRGVRTVRRWERDEGLPVHRHAHRVLGSVYAFKSELEAWRRIGRAGGKSLAPRLAGNSDIKSIVVLPFASLSTDPENAYFADGLTDEVTADLSRIGGLRVISRTSAMTFKGTTKDASTIAKELRVRYILEGSVRRAGDRLRVTAQLIDGATDHHLWADKFDGLATDVFIIQERLARVIVQALEVRLSAQEDQQLADRPLVNLPAYECYLQARQEAWRWRQDAIDHAVQLLRNGLAIVGANGRLYAALGHAYLQYREAGIDLTDRPLQEAEECVRQLCALEPRSASALQLRGWVHYGRGRIQEAVDDLKAALHAQPNNADTLLLLANCYLISGQVRSARPLISRVLAIDPLTPLTQCMPAFADAMDGNFAAVLDPYRQMFEMDPGNPMARLFYVWALAINRRHEAIGTIVETTPAELRETVPARLAGFLARAAAHDGAAAQAVITKDIEAVASGADVFPRLIAQGYGLAGMSEPAMHWLAVAVERGFINYPFLAVHDPCFEKFRGQRRFRALLDSVRVRWEQFRA